MSGGPSGVGGANGAVDGLRCVELEVTAEARVDAMLRGVSSRNSAYDCEDGQTCREDLTCSD